jgi:predicted ATPase
MFNTVRYGNFKVLQDATLPLGRFTLLVGPNGSGKSTALQALRAAAWGQSIDTKRTRSLGADGSPEVALSWDDGNKTVVRWDINGNLSRLHNGSTNHEFDQKLAAVRFYNFDGPNLAAPVTLQPNMELGPNGQQLAGVLDRLRDQDPERFQALNSELENWLPEFDRILFNTPGGGTREIELRVKRRKQGIRASDVSDGTLFALAMLTVAYSTQPPPFVAIEEPERGIHPRLLRRVQDALYRLAFPEKNDESRDPVQVVVTTHSPFLLDLYRDHPEEIVLAERIGLEARFARLVDKESVSELLGDSRLGDLWYSGILGGVPVEQ